VAQGPLVFLLQVPPGMEQEVGGAGIPDGLDTGQELQPVANCGVDSKVHTLQMEDGSIQEDGKVEELLSGEDSSQADSLNTNELEMALKEWGDEEENSKPPSAEEMAATPEALPEQSAARRSKHRVGEVDEDERHKAFRNKGNSVEPNSVYLAQDSVSICNLNSIGISLGVDDVSTNESM
jgi:hypothetical protein